MEEICKNCEMRKIHHLKSSVGLRCPVGSTNFVPSGRVSVPVGFIDAVRGIVNPKKCVCEPYTKCCYHVETYEKLRSMLDKIEGGA
jgi:hypothetical protein